MAKPKISNKMFANMPSSRLLKQTARINKIHGDASNAYTLPNVKKVDVILPFSRVYQPAFGLRQFWKHHLPTLKFHNYDAEFNVLKVNAETDAELKQCPVKVVVHGSSKHEINALGLQPGEILDKLIQVTNAQPVPESELKQLDLHNVSP